MRCHGNSTGISNLSKLRRPSILPITFRLFTFHGQHIIPYPDLTNIKILTSLANSFHLFLPTSDLKDQLPFLLEVVLLLHA
jgi:hypothetical protein